MVLTDEQLREKLAAILLVPNVTGYDWNVGIALLKEWKDEIDQICALLTAQVEAARQAERERILTYLQDLIDLSEKVKEPAVRVRMMEVLEVLKGRG